MKAWLNMKLRLISHTHVLHIVWDKHSSDGWPQKLIHNARKLICYIIIRKADYKRHYFYRFFFVNKSNHSFSLILGYDFFYLSMQSFLSPGNFFMTDFDRLIHNSTVKECRETEQQFDIGIRVIYALRMWTQTCVSFLYN